MTLTAQLDIRFKIVYNWVMMTFKCSKCGKDLPLAMFHRKKCGRGHRTVCKDCHNKYVREVWYPKNKKKQIAATAAWKKRNKTVILASKYGVSTSEIDSAIRESGGRCGICGKETKLCVDHDHSSGRIRGMLCRGCNSALGHFGDSVDGVEKVIRYLNNAG